MNWNWTSGRSLKMMLKLGAAPSEFNARKAYDHRMDRLTDSLVKQARWHFWWSQRWWNRLYLRRNIENTSAKVEISSDG